MEKDIKEQEAKLEQQKQTIELLENILQIAEEKELKADNEIKLLKQENAILKLKCQVDSKESSQSIQGLEAAISKSVSNSISKSITCWVKSNSADNIKVEEDNSENDIYYDK
jgi:hypothetical protein